VWQKAERREMVENKKDSPTKSNCNCEEFLRLVSDYSYEFAL
jgi:hypothetical protein